MNDDKVFPDTQQELKNLCEDIIEIKRQLKEIASKLGQIERHASRAYGPFPTSPKLEKKKTVKASPEVKPTISPIQALELFDQLASVYNQDKETFENKLANISTPDLKLIARELGITFRSKPSRKALYATIRGRINERIMLSENTNVTLPKTNIAAFK